MYEDGYDLSDSERLEVQQILAEMSLRGGRMADSHGRPLAYQVLQMRRFLVCDKGLVWRYAPAGSPQTPGQATGVPRRNSAVEMWTGKWRKVVTPDGEGRYAKCLIWVPLDENINGHPGISKLGWYRSEKGFKHPLDHPHSPTDEEAATIEGRARTATGAVYARMQAEGLNLPEQSSSTETPSSGASKRKPKRAS